MDGVRTVDLECSPRTYQLVQDNPEMIEQILGVHHQVELQTSGNLLSTIKCENDDDDGGLIETDCYTKIIWHETPVRLMLTLVKELRSKVGKTARLKTIKRMWEIVKTRMQEQGYDYTSTQIENKFRGMEKKFKTNQSLKAKGIKYKPFEYEKELADILEGESSIFSSHVTGEHTYTIKPKRRRKRVEETQMHREGCNVAISMETENSMFYESESGNHTSHEVSASTSSANKDCPCTCPKKSVKLEDLLNEIQLMRQSKEHFHERVIKMMDEGNKRREKLLQEKNQIYKQILETINNAT